MAGSFRRPPTQAMRMLFAWVGALAVVPVMDCTAAASMLSSTQVCLPILCSVSALLMLILRRHCTRARPVWPSLSVCAVLGALFTSINMSLAMLCAGVFA